MTTHSSQPPGGSEPGTPREPEPASSASARRGRVLVVDDEPLVARALGRIIGTDHDVTGAASGREALELIRASAPFDAILCDLMMPEMTGMDFHAELLRVLPELARRTVFLTGGAFTPEAREFLARVPNARLEKPPSAQELRWLIEAVVRGAQP